MQNNNYVIVVDQKDKVQGQEEKLKAHREGKLHRAFSVFIFNKKGELLLQKRAEGKYHTPGLWSNTCCSHPKAGFDIKEEAKRRLKEEMGIETELKEILSFTYRAEFGELTEYEFDHVFTGNFEGEPMPDKNEVADWKWVGINDLEKAVKENPEKYTPWLKIIFKKVFNHYGGKI